MLVLSIDVGIKNLAHCLFESLKLEILDWGICDLTCPSACAACGKKAKHVAADGTACCAKHSPQNVVTAKKTVDELKAMCVERKLSDEGDRKSLVKRLQLKKVKGAMQMLDTAISKKLTEQYTNRFKQHKVDIVLIENQMAARMKPLQGMLIQYWTMHGAAVEVVSPLNKLKALNMTGTTYAQRKKLGIEHTRRLLKEHSLSTEVFESTKGKKDDLADCFLQGYWYWTAKMRMT
jgi:glycerol-3-phosphate cytidylyltransferase-like family protein